MSRPALIMFAILVTIAGLAAVLTGCVIAENPATDTEGAML